MTTVTFTRKVIAWCQEEDFHDGEYRGPRHPCPAIHPFLSADGHYLQKRGAMVCSNCDYAHLGRKLPEVRGFRCLGCGRPAQAVREE